MYKGIIFDLDGVICFTDQYHYYAWKKLADKLHIPFNEEINKRLRGVSRMESLEIILENSNYTFSDDEKINLADEKNSIYCKSLEQMSQADLSEEVNNTLLELKIRGYKMAIGSSSKNTKMILRLIGLDTFFDAISDGTNIKNSKPDPEVFIKAAELLGEQPSHCLVVEDASAGIEAAIKGGFDSAGLGDAAKYPGVTYPIKKFSDLLSIL